MHSLAVVADSNASAIRTEAPQAGASIVAFVLLVPRPWPLLPDFAWPGLTPHRGCVWPAGPAPEACGLIAEIGPPYCREAVNDQAVAALKAAPVLRADRLGQVALRH